MRSLCCDLHSILSLSLVVAMEMMMVFESVVVNSVAEGAEWWAARLTCDGVESERYEG